MQVMNGKLPPSPMTGRVARVRAPEPGVRMGHMNELIAAATVIVTAAGLWFVGGTRILALAQFP
jgi:hypothetical protein